MQRIVLWLLFFFICLGLGYPTLSRYEPGAVDGLYDARAYAAMVTRSPLLEDQQDLSHRVLVPYLARPIYALSKNHLGTWNPAYFALLVVNSFFIASTAWMLVKIGRDWVCNYPTALLGAFVFLTNFTVSNHHLAGYVDSAVDFALIAIVWSLLSGRWWTLVCWGVLGALAKETFVPLAVVLTTAWLIAEPRQEMDSRKSSRLVWIGLMSIAGLLTVAFLMSHQSPPYNPLSFAASRQAASGLEHFYLLGLIRCLASHEFLFTFGWLLPLGLPRLRRLPRTWVAGATAAALTALALGAYDDALGNAVRPMFSSIGPLLSLSVAINLNEMVSQKPISTTSSR